MVDAVREIWKDSVREIWKDEFDSTFNDGMAQGISQGISQGIAQGISQGISQGKESMIIEMLKSNVSLTNISNWSKLSPDTILRIADKLGIKPLQ